MSAHDEIKARQRRMWTVGDFPDIAKRTVPAAEAVVERLGISAGEKVLTSPPAAATVPCWRLSAGRSPAAST